MFHLVLYSYIFIWREYQVMYVLENSDKYIFSFFQLSFFFFLSFCVETNQICTGIYFMDRERMSNWKKAMNKPRASTTMPPERERWKKKWIKKKKQGEEKKEMGDEWLQWLEAKQVCVVGGRRGRGGPRGSLPRPTWPLPPTWVGGPSHPGFPSCFPASAHVTPGPTSPLLPAAAPGSARLKIELGLSSSKKKST